MPETKGNQVCFQDYNYLPDSFLIEILIKLALKSILKLKAISKQWSSLISDPYFAHCYVARIKDDSLLSAPWALLISHLKANVTDFTWYLKFISSGFSLSIPPTKLEAGCSLSIIGSDNGSLLCFSYSKERESDIYFFICNPLTKKYVTLPKSPTQKYPYNAGFFSQHDGNYKVVRILEKNSSSDIWLKLEIFTSETGRWEELNLLCTPYIRGGAVTYNGILHWTSFDLSRKIVAYDPYKNNHKVRLIDMPTELMEDVPRNRNNLHLRGKLAVSGGNLCYFETYNYEDFTLWALANYETGERNLKHKIRYRDMWLENFYPSSRNPLAMHPFDLDIVYLECKDNVISYTIQTGKMYLILSDSPLENVTHAFAFPPWPTLMAQLSWQPICFMKNNVHDVCDFELSLL